MRRDRSRQAGLEPGAELALIGRLPAGGGAAPGPGGQGCGCCASEEMATATTAINERAATAIKRESIVASILRCLRAKRRG